MKKRSMKIIRLSFVHPRLNEVDVTTLSRVMKKNDYIEVLDLHGSLSAGNSSPDVIRSFVETVLPFHPSLREVRLGGNGLGDGVATMIARALTRMHSSKATQLRILSLDSSRIKVRGFRALAGALVSQSCPVEQRVLSYNHPGSGGCEAIASLLAAATCPLKILYLDGCDLNDPRVEIIAKGLRKNRSLTKLVLSNNFIGDVGCLSIASALRRNGSLNELDLANNVFGDNGLAAIEESFHHVNYALEILRLEDNARLSSRARCRSQRACNASRRAKTVHKRLTSNYVELRRLPLGLLPAALGLVSPKPDLIYAVLKDKPEWFHLRGHP